MSDMSQVIVPKSDQINADSLLAGPMTVTVREVHISTGQDQPVSIKLAETDLVYRPCKSMRRVLVQAWGADANEYVGRTMTLYCDPSVKWAGAAVGGVRISHLSHIKGKMEMALTATKGQRKPYVVLPLAVEPPQDAAKKWADGYVAQVNAIDVFETLEEFAAAKASKLGELQAKRPELYAGCTAALDRRREQLAIAQPETPKGADQ